MIIFSTIAAVLALVVWLIVARPWGSRLGQKVAQNAADETIASVRLKIEKLRQEHAAGVLSDAVFKDAQADLERQLVGAVLAAPTASTPVQTMPRRLAYGLAAAIVLVAGGMYAWIGNPNAVNSSVRVESKPTVEAAGDNPHATNGDPNGVTFEQMAQRTEVLAAKLKDNPNDLSGWSMLARSYSVLGKFPESASAFSKAVALAPKDAQLAADYADALAMANGRSLQGEASKWIERALQLDPNQLKALSLAGTAAYDKKDYKTAMMYWERALKVAPEQGDFARQINGSLTEVKKLLQGKGAASAEDVTAQDNKSSQAKASGASVRGTVTLSDSLRSKVKPDDAVFIFAVPVNARMPVAVSRHQVKDLPITYELNDSMAMSSEMKLSDQAKVVIKVRVSKTGDAMPKAGDLEGIGETVSPGAKNINVQISSERKS